LEGRSVSATKWFEMRLGWINFCPWRKYFVFKPANEKQHDIKGMWQ